MTAYVSNDIFGPDGGVGEVGQGVNWFTIIEPSLRMIDTTVITESPTLLDGMYDYFEDCPNSSGEDQCQDHMFVLDVGRVEQFSFSGRLTIFKNNVATEGSLWASDDGLFWERKQNISFSTETAATFIISSVSVNTFTTPGYRYIGVSVGHRDFRITELGFEGTTAYISSDIVFVDGGVVQSQTDWNVNEQGVMTEPLNDGLYTGFPDCPNSAGEDQCQDHAFVLDFGRIERGPT
eukprot:UN25405